LRIKWIEILNNPCYLRSFAASQPPGGAGATEPRQRRLPKTAGFAGVASGDLPKWQQGDALRTQ